MTMTSVKTAMSLLAVGLLAAACAGAPTTQVSTADKPASHATMERNLAQWDVGINNDQP